MGAFTLTLVVLLAAAEPPPSAVPHVVVPPPDRPIFIKPVVLEHVSVVGEEPRYVAATRLDKIGRIWAPVSVNGQGPFRLEVPLSAPIDAKRVVARSDRGLLRITLPKRAEAR